MNYSIIHLLEWPKSRTRTISNAGENMKQQELFIYCWLECKIVELHCKAFLKQKSIHTLARRSCNCAPWYLLKGDENICLHKSLHMDVYSSFMHNFQKMPFTRNGYINCSTCGQWNIINARKKWTIKLWMDIEEHYLKWNKSNKDKYCVISLICGILKKNKKAKLIATESRIVVIKGWMVGKMGRCWS